MLYFANKNADGTIIVAVVFTKATAEQSKRQSMKTYRLHLITNRGKRRSCLLSVSNHSGLLEVI